MVVVVAMTYRSYTAKQAAKNKLATGELAVAAPEAALAISTANPDTVQMET